MRTATKQKMKKTRYDELKRILEDRRLEIIGEMRHKMRDVRTEHATIPQQGVRDEAESSEADIQDDIEFALLQMKAETLKKIGDAVARLDEGGFGYCYECGEEIAGRRLRALPFAVRCKNCEESREFDIQREQMNGLQRDTLSLFSEHGTTRVDA